MAHRGIVSQIAWSPDGRWLASASWDKTVRIFDTKTDRLAPGNQKDVGSKQVLSPDRRWLATWSLGKAAQIVEVATGGELARVIHDDSVEAVAWSPDGTKLATGSSDKTARIVEAATGKELVRVTHDDTVWALVWSPNGKQLAIESSSKSSQKFRIVDAVSGNEIALGLRGNKINSLAWSKDGMRLALGIGKEREPGEALFIEAATGQVIFRAHHDHHVTVVAWSQDGGRLATGSGLSNVLGELRVLEPTTGTELARAALDDAPSSIAWSPDGTKLAIQANGDAVQIIETTNAKKVAQVSLDKMRIPFYNKIIWSTIGESGASGIFIDGDLLRVFPTSQALVDAAKSRASRCLTKKEREQYFLPLAPPTWCVERQLWPYHAAPWQTWLPLQKAWLANDRRGKAPNLPNAEEFCPFLRIGCGISNDPVN